MKPANTEQLHDQASGLDMRPETGILSALLAGQRVAIDCVEPAIDSIGKAAGIAAATISSGNRLAFAAAGSSGLMAMADALELPGTFGINKSQIVILMAGGAASLSSLEGGPEDREDLAVDDFNNSGLGKGDCLLAVSASGSTPYVLAMARLALINDVTVIGIANNPQAPLLQMADETILVATPAELIAGSTRLGAASAQKVALNMLSTLMAVKLGHIYNGYMVNLRADNDKLRQRALRMVAEIAECDNKTASLLLEKSMGSVKLAILLASGVSDLNQAEKYLDRAGQNLRTALAEHGRTNPSH